MNHAPLIETNGPLHQQMQQWRRDFHAHPETAFEEHRTAARVAELLTQFGLEVHRGLAGTGVVATLAGKEAGKRSIACRADMDALNLEELNTFDHCSVHPGKMHGCGHDGHTAMLLGAAAHLAEHPHFAGQAVFIFQPAEEGEGGARVMCDEGLFEQFPVDAVYGMHNWPGIPAGHFAIHDGAVMASMDFFEITITGKGGHGAMPHLGIDPIAAAGQLITAIQTIISRNIDPTEGGVVSVTQMQGGNAFNVIPDTVTLAGTCRTFSAQTQERIEAQLNQLVEHICQAFGARGQLDYQRCYPATINHKTHAQECYLAAESLVHKDQIQRNPPPSMGAEDFAFMLNERPGAYIWIGNGASGNGHGLHNPYYDFNDAILPLGANYWITLIQQQLNGRS